MGFPSLSGGAIAHYRGRVLRGIRRGRGGFFGTVCGSERDPGRNFPAFALHTPDTVGPALAATIIKLAPLTDRNAEFSEQVLLVYQAYLELFG